MNVYRTLLVVVLCLVAIGCPPGSIGVIDVSGRWEGRTTATMQGVGTVSGDFVLNIVQQGNSTKWNLVEFLRNPIRQLRHRLRHDQWHSSGSHVSAQQFSRLSIYRRGNRFRKPDDGFFCRI